MIVLRYPGSLHFSLISHVYKLIIPNNKNGMKTNANDGAIQSNDIGIVINTYVQKNKVQTLREKQSSIASLKKSLTVTNLVSSSHRDQIVFDLIQ